MISTVEEVAVYVEGGGRLRVDDLEPIAWGTPMQRLRAPYGNLH
ncbi:hypothetical protein [Amycolatopsis nigrescens]|nr:hypothetical protein [Amycolatopsis nigrescens]